MCAFRKLSSILLFSIIASCQVAPPANDFVPRFSLDPAAASPPQLNAVPCVGPKSSPFEIRLDDATVLSGQRSLSGKITGPFVGVEDLPDDLRAAFDASDQQPMGDMTLEVVDAESCEVRARVPVTMDKFPKRFEIDAALLGDLADGNHVLRAASADARFPVSAQRFVVSESRSLCSDANAGRVIFEMQTGDRGLAVEGFKAPDSAILCIDVTSENGVDSLVVNGQELLAYDRRKSETIKYPSIAGLNVIGLEAEHGAGIRIRELPVAVAAADKLRENWLCRGRLAGFIDYGINTTRRPIPRAGVRVSCAVTFQILRIEGIGSIEVQTIKVVNAVNTDDSGSFEIPFHFNNAPLWGIPEDATLVSVVASCATAQCGVDAMPTRAIERPVPSNAEGFHANFEAVINNVVDVSVGGLVARLVTTDQNPHRPSRAPGELVSAGIGGAFSNPNDYPVIYHEAFDPLREDGTRYLYWLLSGQYVDLREEDGSDIFSSPCEGIIRGPCIPCTRFLEDCDPVDINACIANAEGGVPGFQKAGLDVMAPMVNNGYDVWLVDSTLRDGTVLEVARRSPALYQAILDFPRRDKHDVSLPVAAPAIIPERRLAVGGVSTGGLVARAALRLWELRDEIQQDTDANGLYLLYPPNAVTDTPDRVAYYFSIETPHKGALLPPTLQAFITDKDFKATAPDSRRIRDLLESNAIRELVANYVEPGRNTPCWDGDGVDKCTFDISDISPPGNAGPDGNPATPDSRFQILQRLLTTGLDSYDPDNSIAMSGLPVSMPRVAISNGSMTQSPIVDDNRLARFKVDGWILVVVVIFPVPLHIAETANLNDSVVQPQGSGLPQVCDLKRGEGSQSVNDFDWISTAGDVDVDIDIFMHPGDRGDNVYPTFVRTPSAFAVRDLSNDSRSLMDDLWADAMAPNQNLPHFAVTEQQCQFIMYHLDGWMRGDKDGFPRCSGAQTNCADGARNPGFILNPFSASSSAFCDPNDNDADIHPWIIRFGEILKNYQTGDALLIEPGSP